MAVRAGMVERMMNRFGFVPRAKGPNREEAAFFGWDRRSPSGPGVERPFEQHAWVYACVRAISTSLAQVPFKLYRDGKEAPEAIEEGPLYDVFNTVNPIFSRYQLWEATMVWMQLQGEAFWVLEREKVTDPPQEIWVLPPTRFEPDCDENTGLPLGWFYTGKRGKKIPLALHRVVHLRYLNPYNDLRGLSPLSAARKGIDQDWWASLYNEAFFREGAHPGGVITTEENLDDTKYDRLKNQWEERHKGTGKAHRIAVIGGGGKYTPFQVPHKDMEFIEQRKWGREEVLAVFNVPKSVATLFEDVQFANMQVQDKAFWQRNLLPNIRYIEDVLWSQVFSKIDGGRVWGAFDTSGVAALQKDFKEQVNIGRTLMLMGYPINAINQRLELGMPEVEWGDDFFTWFSMVPAAALLDVDPAQLVRSGNGAALKQFELWRSMLETGDDPTQAGMMKAWEALLSLPKEHVDKLAGRLIEVGKVQQGDEVEKSAVRDSYVATLNPLEEKYRSTVRRFFRDQRRTQLRRLEEAGKGPGAPQWAEGFSTQERATLREIGPVLREIGEAAMAAVFDGAEADVDHFRLALSDGERSLVERLYKIGAEEIEEILFVLDGEHRKLVRASRPHFESALKEGGAMIAVELGIEPFFDPLAPDVVEFFESSLANLVRVNRTVRDQLRRTLLEGIAAEESVGGLTDRVKAVYNFTDARSLTIARTEMGGGLSGGREEAMKQAGVWGSKWLTAGDEHTRTTHRINGEVRALGERFSNGLRRPHDPGAPAKEVANCRCVTVPVEKE